MDPKTLKQEWSPFLARFSKAYEGSTSATEAWEMALADVRSKHLRASLQRVLTDWSESGSLAAALRKQKGAVTETIAGVIEVSEEVGDLRTMSHRLAAAIAAGAVPVTTLSKADRPSRACQVRQALHEVAALIGMGLPLLRSLRYVERDLGDCELAPGIGRIAERINQGDTLHGALRQEGDVHPVIVTMVRAGEAGGVLDVILTRLVEAIDRGFLDLDAPADIPAERRSHEGDERERARMWYLMGMLMSSGVPILEVFNLTKTLMPLKELRDWLTSAHDAIREGQGIHDAMKACPGLFTTQEMDTVNQGEQTGHVDRSASDLALWLNSGGKGSPAAVDAGTAGTPGQAATDLCADSPASADEAPVVRLVNLILLQANKDRASDIHFESYEDKFAVRYRVDGILYEMEPPPRRLGPAILSRIKIMARMDIAEKRLPQDGRIELRVQGESIDLRVSTIPTVTGEHCVIRILRRNDALISLDHLELTKDLLGTLKSWAQSPNGLVVISGPAGSGKTTVLYALLNWINRPNRRIITVEDPVEYRLPGISQMQVNTQLGLNASRSIESALRQDPDVLALTLIDDVDTLTSACKAVLTGHLVLANLMASSATGAIARMLNLGCEPSILAGSLQGISCQRLVRRLCECKRQVALKDLTPLERKVLGSHVQGPYFVAQGCEKCHQIGYRGRVAIFEMVPITEDLRGAILKRRPERRLEKLLARHGARSLWDDGLDKAAAGITSVAEVLHVTGGPHLTEETA